MRRDSTWPASVSSVTVSQTTWSGPTGHVPTWAVTRSPALTRAGLRGASAVMCQSCIVVRPPGGGVPEVSGWWPAGANPFAGLSPGTIAAPAERALSAT